MVKYPDSDKTCRKGTMSSWIILILAGICESVWATALDKSQGFTKIIPDIVFVVGLVLSMVGLAFAMRSIPTSTAYVCGLGRHRSCIDCPIRYGYGLGAYFTRPHSAHHRSGRLRGRTQDRQLRIDTQQSRYTQATNKIKKSRNHHHDRSNTAMHLG
ncbi:DMT family transporter [Bifidobacterium asteroides]|uniref:DMT family transporter n=1 Tax=Bifidobacterium asteroides TaxID=1684 RepID=UPI0035CCF2CE